MTPPPRTPSVVVTNPGPLRWKHQIANSLAQTGYLRSYITTFVSSPELERRVARVLPARASQLATRYLRLRRLPSGIPEQQVQRVAQTSGLLTAAAFRASSSPRVHTAMFAFGDRRFDTAAAAHLRGGDRVAIVACASSLRTIESARRHGITTVLDYPTGHCDFESAITREEHRLRPDFAGTLPLAYTGEARQALLKAEIAAADRILVNSTFARDTFIDQGVDAARVLVIHHAVDLKMFRPGDAARDDGRFRVLFAGRITQLKGIAYVIDGFDRAAIPGSELRFLGKPFGTTEPWQSHPRLYHRAAVPIHQLRDEYVSADVYVLPSLFEGFPHTAIMAMACGLPCIVSEHTFGSDVITDGVDGFVVPIRDPDAIAERLVTLHRDPDLRSRMGAAARERAETFTWERFGRQITDLVSDLGA
jgi:starch synthase